MNDELIRHYMEEWKVPGLALAVIKKGKVILSKGFGVARVGKSRPVNEETIFAIGSTTKAFTAKALEILVKKKRLRWDDPVLKHLPSFQLADPHATRELTIRDLLSHRGVLEPYSGALLWYGTNYTREEIVYRMRLLQPYLSIRYQFSYQNLTYLVLGELLAKVSGKTWDEFIQERIFKPFKMNSSSTTIRQWDKQTNVASPHVRQKGVIVPVPWMNIDNIGPAASINSTLADMTKWLKRNMRDKESEIFAPQMVVQRSEPICAMLYPKSQFLCYGLGWFLFDYAGRKVVQHDGLINKMTSLVAFIPEEELGIVILTNLEESFLPHVLMYQLFDHHLGLKTNNWHETFWKCEAELSIQPPDPPRVEGTKPSLPLHQYVGTYEDHLYGKIWIKEENGKLQCQLLAVEGHLEHWHFDIFQFQPHDTDLMKPLITFSLNQEGKLEKLQVDLPDLIDRDFKKRSIN